MPMLVSSAGVFGVSVVELAVLLAGIGYVVSLIKDWRPVRTLRADNHELRRQLAEAERKIEHLEAQVRALEQATDLTAIAAALERVVAKLESLDSAVHANTAAIEAIARSSALREALADPPERSTK